MGDNYNFHRETQFIKEAKDNVSITQNIYTNADFKKEVAKVTNDFNEKLDLIISKQNEAKIDQEKAMEETLNLT